MDSCDRPCGKYREKKNDSKSLNLEKDRACLDVGRKRPWSRACADDSGPRSSPSESRNTSFKQRYWTENVSFYHIGLEMQVFFKH